MSRAEIRVAGYSIIWNNLDDEDRVQHSTPTHYYAEGSTLGLEPGEWPQAIVVEWDPRHEERFVRDCRYPGGEVLYVTERRGRRIELVVANT